jgi:hypothetical protein
LVNEPSRNLSALTVKANLLLFYKKFKMIQTIKFLDKESRGSDIIEIGFKLVIGIIQPFSESQPTGKKGLKLPAARPVDELRSSRCRESSKCKEVIPFYCSSLANPAAPETGFPPRFNKLRGMRSL